ncbi:MAG TPA: YeeE/YedE thiosulfate transporter family protein [Steroidobacteraceae bacterium]|nr:YeeE/YedE thiosulfate transporter family protein [Steroidobacteraceae bacterium]
MGSIPITRSIPSMSGWAGGLAGGAMIGAGAVLLLWSIGRIAGISGIASGALEGARGDRAWRIAFLAGMMLAGALALQFVAAPVRTQTGSTTLLLAAGLLVGFGTRLGNGCTSGHGVCGLARLSRRSLVAVLTFMGVAMATTFVVRHVIGAPA